MTPAGRGQRPEPGTRSADSRRRVLLIEDDRDIAEAIGYQLEKAGLQVRFAYTGEEGLEAARRGVDLVLLDLNLPNMDGLEVCRMIRRQSATAHVPIIIVSARGEEVDRVLGLEMGADDYVVKPFSLKELTARCRVALRRSDATSGPAEGYRDDDFEVEFEAFVVRYRGEEIRLTPKEFNLFRYLVERRGRVVTRERLPSGGSPCDGSPMIRLDASSGISAAKRATFCQSIAARIRKRSSWPSPANVETRSIDAHIRRLRVKLGPARDHIETIVGLGYRFVPSPSAPSDAG